MNFNADEAIVMWENGILVPSAWHLPHGWHISAAGYGVPPLLEGDMLDDIIDQLRHLLLPVQRNLPENAPRHSIWLPHLQRELQEELGKFVGPYAGRYNLAGRRDYWRNRDVDDVLREHNYVYVSRRLRGATLARRRPRRGLRHARLRRTGALRRSPP
jgi:hypothetical protein